MTKPTEPGARAAEPPRSSATWGQDMATRQWWLVYMRDGEPGNAYHPEHGWKAAWRDSFCQWHRTAEEPACGAEHVHLRGSANPCECKMSARDERRSLDRLTELETLRSALTMVFDLPSDASRTDIFQVASAAMTTHLRVRSLESLDVEVIGPVAMLEHIEHILADARVAPEDGDSLADAVQSIVEELAAVDQLTAERNESRERARVAELELCGLRIDMNRGIVDTVRSALVDEARIRAEEREKIADAIERDLTLLHPHAMAVHIRKLGAAP